MKGSKVDEFVSRFSRISIRITKHADEKQIDIFVRKSVCY